MVAQEGSLEKLKEKKHKAIGKTTIGEKTHAAGEAAPRECKFGRLNRLKVIFQIVSLSSIALIALYPSLRIVQGREDFNTGKARFYFGEERGEK
jgi:hypothetical protein